MRKPVEEAPVKIKNFLSLGLIVLVFRVKNNKTTPKIKKRTEARDKKGKRMRVVDVDIGRTIVQTIARKRMTNE